MKEIYYDETLKIEACHFEGIVQPFPNHFHDYYVIGYVKEGYRILSCKNREYEITPNDILIFNCEENHACYQKHQEIFDYYGFNISQDVMKELMKDITGKSELPTFHPTVFKDEEILYCLKNLHQCIIEGSKEFEKDELLFLMCSILIKKYTQSFQKQDLEYHDEIKKICQYIENYYNQNISLNDLCYVGHLSKSTLLRAFSKIKGITPYRYLQTIRINKAKELLEKGETQSEVALKTGFNDQSHFYRFFIMFTGVTPKMYKDMFHKEEI